HRHVADEPPGAEEPRYPLGEPAERLGIPARQAEAGTDVAWLVDAGATAVVTRHDRPLRPGCVLRSAAAPASWPAAGGRGRRRPSPRRAGGRRRRRWAPRRGCTSRGKT